MELISFFTDYLGPRILGGIQFESTRYAMGTLVTFFVLWVVLHRFIETRKIRKPTPRNKQIQMELKHSFKTVCVFVAMDIFIFEAADIGLFQKYDDFAEHGMLWFWISIPLLIILHDTYFYWTHRAMHTATLYKRTHMQHHRSHNPTPFTAYNFAIGEAIIEYMYVPLALMLIPTHNLALYIVLSIMIFKNALAHCGYEVFPRSWARMPVLGWLTTVTHHDMHHERGTGNFGFYFTWWDRWMGTEHPNYLDRLDEQEARAQAIKAARRAAKKRPQMVPAE